jgi:hypothetical protein
MFLIGEDAMHARTLGYECISEPNAESQDTEECFSRVVAVARAYTRL